MGQGRFPEILPLHLLHSSIPRPSIHYILKCCNCNCQEHQLIIDQYHDSIVNALKIADRESVPKIKPKTLKNYWSEELNTLKQSSIDLHNLWRLIGSPRNNSLINLERLKVKYQYKNAIKTAKNTSERINAEKINSSFLNKKSTSFWKSWNYLYKKDNSTGVSPIINNLSNHQEIAEAFRDYFGTTYIDSSNDPKALEEFNNIKHVLSVPGDTFLSIDINDIDIAIQQLSLNKSPDHEELVAEHIYYSHPAIAMHLKHLFTLILNHSYVPKSFTFGAVTPIIKDKRGDIT